MSPGGHSSLIGAETPGGDSSPLRGDKSAIGSLSLRPLEGLVGALLALLLSLETTEAILGF